MAPRTAQRVNRTGLGFAPELAQELIEGAEASTPSSAGNAGGIEAMRAIYADAAEPIGTVPASVTPGKETKKARKKPTPALLDKLGGRLAFERSGVRLYEGVLLKYRVHGSWDGGPTEAELEHLRSEEREHFLMLHEKMEGWAQTPVL